VPRNRLSILERATDHGCINNCNHPKEMWVGFKCNGLVIFLREEVFQNITHAFSRPSPPPPLPASPTLLGPPSSVVVERDISGSGAPTGVFFPKKGDPSNVTGVAGIFDGSEPWENSVGSQEAGDDQQGPLPAPLVSLVRDLETNGMGGGGVKLGLRVVLRTPN
jgi:hypothetical protein